MNNRIKRVLSSKEASAFVALRSAGLEHDLHVFPKMRLCDVVEIKNSGLSLQEFEYASRAHFDFVLATKDYRACLAIETDFSSDYSPKWIENAELKDRVCNELALPQVRIDCSQLAYYQVEDFMHLLVESFLDGHDKMLQVPSIKYNGCLLHSHGCCTESCSEFAAISAWLLALHHDDNQEIKPTSALLSSRTYDSDDGYFISSIDLKAGKTELQIASAKCRVSPQAQMLGRRLSLSLAASVASREIEEIRNHVFASEEPCSLDIEWTAVSTGDKCEESSAILVAHSQPSGPPENDGEWAQNPAARILTAGHHS